MSDVKFTKNVWNEQDSGRLEDIVYEVARLTPWGLSDESTFEMAVKSIRDDGGARCDSPLTVNKFVALVQLIPVFCEEPKERLIALARREIRRRRRFRALRKREFKQWYSAFCRADKAMGGVTESRSANPEGYARRDALISDYLMRRPVVWASGHAPRSSRHAARSATSTSPGSSDDGSSDGPSDDPASPVTPLVFDIDKRRNSLHSEHSHKYRITDLIDKLTLGCAGLLAAVLASLIVGWSR